jgi:hypothetical protein
MSNGGRPDFQFFVFDVVDRSGRRPFTERWKEVTDRSKGWPSNVGLVLQVPVEDLERLKRFDSRTWCCGKVTRVSCCGDPTAYTNRAASHWPRTPCYAGVDLSNAITAESRVADGAPDHEA